MGETAEILIVDDDADVRSLVRAALEGDGYAVTEARSGVEAMERVRARRPGLVLLDVNMPEMNGFAVAHAIKEERGAFLPVILLTALADTASRQRGIDAGADEVLSKPFYPDELRLRVRAMLRIQRLADELHKANQRLAELARTDELTKVRNRRGLRSALEREFLRAVRYGGGLALMIFDVDHFKSVNDAYGHQVGDRMLIAVAQALKNAVRQVDVVARLGGEEFVVVAPETRLREAGGLAERLRQAAASAVVELRVGPPLRVTVSCGAATIEAAQADSPSALLALADRALYRAKELGRNRTELHTDDGHADDAPADDRLGLFLASPAAETAR